MKSFLLYQEVCQHLRLHVLDILVCCINDLEAFSQVFETDSSHLDMKG